MSNLNTTSFSEPITDPDILAGIEALPTPDDLPCDDGEPMETPRHRQQMEMLIQSLNAHWTERTQYYVGGICLSITTRSSATVFADPTFFWCWTYRITNGKVGWCGTRGCVSPM